ncbi:MAG: ABC transporter ATP-binding protein [Treponema sp.]|jgi:ABC-2 type transport system ATP-binding protein|nr:ABC transporter ATP-binding protein [Treponema sp.]
MIKVSGLTKFYGSRLAIDNISFSVSAGEVVGLLGLNGAGKSTIMNIIAGCLSSSSGQVLINGRSVEEEPDKAKQSIGYLPEIPPLYTDMKVDEYLAFVYDLKKPAQKRVAHLDEIREKTGLTGVRGRLLKNLSKGYRQRAGLAAALVGDPEILILDEPTAGLDPTQIIEIRKLIKDLGEKRATLFSSHILSEVEAVSSRVLVLNHGILAADDSPENLAKALRDYSRYVAVIEGDPRGVLAVLGEAELNLEVKQLDAEGENAWAYLLSGEGDIRRSVAKALAGAGYLLLNTRQQDVSLENIFLRLVADKRE